MSLAASFCCVVSLFDGVASGATTAPVVTSLPVIKEGAVTPTRIAQRASTGYIYVTDPHAEGVNVYRPDGSLAQKFLTATEPGGIAFAKNGELLVCQSTYIAVLNPDTGVERTRFGSFKYAFSIAVDDRPAGTGRIFISDIKNYVVQVFDDTYAEVAITGTGHNTYNPDPAYRANFIGDSYLTPYTYDPNFILPDFTSLFNRPAGVAIEKSSGKLAVVDSLNAKIRFFDMNGNAGEVIGTFGYDSAHTFVALTYPQSIAFEYTATGVLDRAYILDTFQSYVMVLDATAPQATSWSWLADIGLYGHHNGDLIVPSDIFIDKYNANNNRLLVSNGFGSLSVFGLSSLQPYNVFIDTIGSDRMTIHWTKPASASITGFKVYRSTDPTLPLTSWTLVGGAVLPSTATSIVDGPPSQPALAQYTTYYYTVRAVLGATETSNIDQVSAKTTGSFNLSVNIVGSGQVNGTLSCTSGTCSSIRPSDSTVTLTATATGQSVFDGWTGDCLTTAETCLLTMDAAKLVTAIFSAQPAFRVDGAYFDNLQDAYNAAAAKTDSYTTIKVLAGGPWPSTTHPTEYMTAWQGKTVIIEGGYDPTFTTNAGAYSTVTGQINLMGGKVVMKQFRIK
jgi:hypothetical protein